MITIEDYRQIDKALIKIDQEATKALKKGLKFTIEYRTNGITKKQFNAMHKWFDMCAEYLNESKHYRLSPVSGKKIPWTLTAFKEDVYKPVLNALSEKKSTKEQNTVEPNEIREIITAHLATAWQDKTIILPEWPSNRG